MDVQAAPPPYTPVGGSNTQSGNPPVLGGQMLGATGGLPPTPGLSATKNPMAEQLQSMGRGEDKMLVHMTPDEVNSLRGLAQRFGGDLTTNPDTGLPEANFLKKLLPTLLGVGLNFLLPGSGGIVGALGGKAATAGLATAAAGTALTGDLNKGLMAGLQAFGGASLAGGLEGAMSGAAKTLPSTTPSTVLTPAGPVSTGAIPAGVPGVTSTVKTGLPGFTQGFGNTAKGTMTGLAGKAAPMMAATGALSAFSDVTAPQLPKYKEGENTSKYVPMGPGRREVRFQTPEQMRASGGAEFSYFTPSNPDPVPLYGQPRFAEGGEVQPQQDFNNLVAMYQAQNPGAITASMFPTPTPSANPSITPSAPPAGIAPAPVGETMHNFNRPTTPQPVMGGLGGLGISEGLISQFGPEFLRRRTERNNRGRTDSLGSVFDGSRDMGFQRLNLFASGGAVDMQDGSFVVDARTVSELGNGSSNAGIELLSRMGGRPVHGPGDGVSDSVKASIGGKQEARVARDEVIFSPEAVRRIGGGSEAKGTQKLYAMMDKAHKARKKAARGQDTKLRKGLA